MHRVRVDSYITGFSPVKLNMDYTTNGFELFHEEMKKLYGYSADIEVGEYTYGVPNIRWWGEKAKLRVGKFCSIARDVTIFLGGENEISAASTYSFLWFPSEWGKVNEIQQADLRPYKGDVIIGHDVWIGHGATILSGVTIGDGAVIGARAVVSKNIPAYSVYAGNPVKFIKDRFAEDIKAQLLDIRWWDWSKSKINNAIPFLISRDPLELIRFHHEYGE